MIWKDLVVRAGDPVLPAVQALTKLQRSLRILPGVGILLSQTTAGVVINARPLARGFVGAFAVTLFGDSVQIGEGYVNGLLPVINEKPILEKPGDPPSRLQIKLDGYDLSGRSWICLQVKVDEFGKIIQPDENGDGSLELEVVQRDSNSLFDPVDDRVGYHPIAMLRRAPEAKGDTGQVHQIAMFDYQHRTAKQEGKFVHFFDPA